MQCFTINIRRIDKTMKEVKDKQTYRAPKTVPRLRAARYFENCIAWSRNLVASVCASPVMMHSK